MRAESKAYAGLTVSSAAGDVEFVEGVAEVTEAQAKALRKLPEEFGITIHGGPEDPKKPEGESDKSAASDEPKGNASLEEWQAYAVAKGIPAENVADLKREEIKQLLAE